MERAPFAPATAMFPTCNARSLSKCEPLAVSDARAYLFDAKRFISSPGHDLQVTRKPLRYAPAALMLAPPWEGERSCVEGSRQWFCLPSPFSAFSDLRQRASGRIHRSLFLSFPISRFPVSF